MLAKKGDAYFFSCKDNGIGISAEDQPHIFERLYRASNARSAKENGTGLGLYIVKMIVDSIGWKVSFKSAIAKGTTFFVEIPQQEAR